MVGELSANTACPGKMKGTGITMIKRAEEKDMRIIAEMAVMMWHGHSIEDLTAEFAALL